MSCNPNRPWFTSTVHQVVAVNIRAHFSVLEGSRQHLKSQLSGSQVCLLLEAASCTETSIQAEQKGTGRALLLWATHTCSSSLPGVSSLAVGEVCLVLDADSLGSLLQLFTLA